MNEQIRQLAKQAGFSAKHTDVYFDRQLERFAALVRADEREQCAKECDKIAHRNSGLERGVGASWCAWHIRAAEIGKGMV
jgi:hypothetical protein